MPLVAWQCSKASDRKIHIPPNYVVKAATTQRKPPEVRICRLSIQGRGAWLHSNVRTTYQEWKSIPVLTLPKFEELSPQMGMRTSLEGTQASGAGGSHAQEANVADVSEGKPVSGEPMCSGFMTRSSSPAPWRCSACCTIEGCRHPCVSRRMTCRWWRRRPCAVARLQGMAAAPTAAPSPLRCPLLSTGAPPGAQR